MTLPNKQQLARYRELAEQEEQDRLTELEAIAMADSAPLPYHLNLTSLDNPEEVTRFIQEATLKALKVLMSIIDSPHAADQAKHRAAIEILEITQGKKKEVLRPQSEDVNLKTPAQEMARLIQESKSVYDSRYDGRDAGNTGTGDGRMEAED